jgi:hypothetical protein
VPQQRRKPQIAPVYVGHATEIGAGAEQQLLNGRPPKGSVVGATASEQGQGNIGAIRVLAA